MPKSLLTARESDHEGCLLLSINDTPAIRRIFNGFALEEDRTGYSVSNADRGAHVCEPIISDGVRDGDLRTML